LTKDEITDIKNRGKRTESLLKNIGHKLYGVNTTKDKPIEIINMNKKKVEKVTIPKLYQEDTNQKDNVNLCQSQTNLNKSKNKQSPSTIPEPSISSCVDIDFDEAELNDCSNTLESTQAQTHSISDTNLSLSN